MPKITNADLTSNSPVIKGDEGVWDAKLNYITELTEDKLNEVITDLNYITGINSVWNVIDYSTFADFPIIGEPMTIYFAIAENKRYMWGGSVYIDLNLGSGTVSSINSRIGDVILNKSDVGLSNVDNTSDQTKANTTNYSTLSTTNKTLTGAINEVKSSADSKAPLSSPTFTGTVTLPSDTSIGTVNATEIGYLDNATSNIQTQLNSKAPTASPTFTGTVVLPTTTSIGNVDSTEISYLDGVTSGIQGQLNNKQPLDSDLTAIADLSSNGIIVKMGSGTAFTRATTRSIATSGSGISVTNGDGISANPTIVSNATSSNTPDTIVYRNASGNFNAGTITATVNGSASTLTTPRTIGTMTGDVTSAGSSFDGSQNNSNVATIGANKVTNAKLAQMPSMTIKGNDAVGNADPQDLTKVEVQTMLEDTTHRFVTDSQISLWNSTAPAIKYYDTQALAITDASNINVGDKIQTFGGSSINDGLGGLYRIESSLSNGGFTIATGKHANYLNMKDLGVGQTWQNVKASRASGTTYTNTTGKPIMALVTGLVQANNNSITVIVNVGGIEISNTAWHGGASAAGYIPISFIVPSGQTYTVTSNGSIGTWSELR